MNCCHNKLLSGSRKVAWTQAAQGEISPAWHRERGSGQAAMASLWHRSSSDAFHSPDSTCNIALPCRKALTSLWSEVQIIRGWEILIWGNDREPDPSSWAKGKQKTWELCINTRKRAAIRRERGCLGSFTEESAAVMGIKERWYPHLPPHRKKSSPVPTAEVCTLRIQGETW